MASQRSSALNEERNRLRLLAWEQRNQETSQSREFSHEKVPVFGEPYKVYKEDELSTRIRRMFGSYEDVKSPRPFSTEGFPIPSYVTVSQSDQGPPNVDKSTRPPFHSQLLDSSAESKTGLSSTPSTHGQSGELSRSQPKRSEVHSDLMEMSSSPHDAKPPARSHSTDPETADTESDRQWLHSSAGPPTESLGTVDVSRDAAVSQINRTGPLSSQSFPPLLSSKQPCSAMTQKKPTAYVRPMDGQDQVVGESPELKPSPEPYAPAAELIHKSGLDRAHTKPQALETRADEARCVEDILKEMTHSWPPVLTALHTPNTQEPSKLLLPVQGTERVSSCPGQKSCDLSSAVSSSLKCQPSSNSSEAAHSSVRETGSSSDSDSSSGSESDSERTAEEPNNPQPDGPALASGDWQLGNWIRSSQQSAGAEVHGGALVSESPAHQQQLHTQSSRASGAEDVHPGGTPRPQLTGEISLLPPDKHRQHSLQKHDPSRKRSKPANAGWPSGRVWSEATLTAQTKESCFADKPKVKTKAAHGKKNKDVDKKVSIKISLKRTKKPSLNGQSAASEPARCPSCSVSYPNRCSCPTRSPAPPGPLPLAPPDTGTPNKSRPESVCSQRAAIPHKRSRKHLKDIQDLSRTPVSLLVKVDLSLLSRVPQIHISSVKTPTREPDEDVSAKRTKTSKKHTAPNVDAEGLSVPKKQKLEKRKNSSAAETSNKPAEVKKKARKTSQQPKPSKDKAPDSKGQKSCSGKTGESGGETVRSKEEKKKQNGSSGKQKECPHSETRSPSAPRPPPPASHALTNRPALRPDHRRHPVKHYIKEAKRLKHQADAEPDKLRKAFSYLEAAMFFVESGIAMERDPHISTSSYTMFSETVELLKFVLKLKTSVDSSSPSEKDFLSLCLKCQALLQMTMFRHKHQTALKYSKALTDYFNTVCQASYSPLRVTDHPCPGATPGPTGATAVLPQAIEQVTFNYVNITSLVLSSHDVWEQAEELAEGGSGVLSELDAALGPLSLSSGMSSMVRYTRQGVHWLRLDSQKG